MEDRSKRRARLVLIVGILIAILVGIFILVGVITAAVIYFAGAQIVNTFSNLVMTPNSP